MVTSHLALAAKSRSRMSGASNKGLMAKTIPAASPPQMTQWVSGRLGRTNAMTSFRLTPSLRNIFAVWVMRPSHSLWVQVQGRRYAADVRKNESAGDCGARVAPCANSS